MHTHINMLVQIYIHTHLLMGAKGAPEQLQLALQRYHDDRLSDVRDVEEVYQSASEDENIEANMDLLETLAPDVIKAALSTRTSSSVVGGKHTY